MDDSMYSEIIETTEDGFEIRFDALVQYDRLEETFDDSKEWYKETYDKIERGHLYWFIAAVTATKNGLDLGTNYLGACLYDDVDDFIKDSGYYEDMKAAAITEAKEKIKLLAEEI